VAALRIPRDDRIAAQFMRGGRACGACLAEAKRADAGRRMVKNLMRPHGVVFQDAAQSLFAAYAALTAADAFLIGRKNIASLRASDWYILPTGGGLSAGTPLPILEIAKGRHCRKVTPSPAGRNSHSLTRPLNFLVDSLRGSGSDTPPARPSCTPLRIEVQFSVGTSSAWSTTRILIASFAGVSLSPSCSCTAFTRNGADETSDDSIGFSEAKVRSILK
jgi:hypothetical protein